MAPNRRQRAAHQAYGQACFNCAKAKCKCIPRATGQICERCHRLNKSCQPSDSIRQLKSDPMLRINQLEGKLDALVSILGAGQVSQLTQKVPQPNHTVSPPESNPISSVSSEAVIAAASPASCPFFTVDISHQEANACFTNFRDNMLKYFAFVTLPDNAEQLRQERPFLFLCVVCVSSQNTQRKLALCDRVKRILAERTITTNDPSAIDLDLLLGLLVFLTWGWDSLLRWVLNNQSRLTQLAMSLVFDLRLNKPPLHETTNMLPIGYIRGKEKTVESTTRSMDERRAVLACFVMSSIVSSYFAQMDPMQWTPYMDACLEMMTKSTESPHDELFSHQVRLQKAAFEVESSRGDVVPAEFYHTALRHRMDGIKAEMSPQVRQNVILLASVYYTELSIFTSGPPKARPLDIQGLEYLYDCLNTAKSALNNFFEIPATNYTSMSFIFFIQLARPLLVLYRLTTLDDPAWNTSLVRCTMDVLQVMSQILSNLEKARDMAGSESADGALDKSVKIFMAVRSRLASRVADAEGQQSGGPAGDSQVQTGGFGDMLLDDAYLNDVWLKDYFAYGFLGEQG